MKIHFVQKMNKVVLKKCDNAAMKKNRARIVLGESGKFIPRAFRMGLLRHLRSCPLTAEKTGIHLVRFPHRMVPPICENVAMKNVRAKCCMMAKAGICLCCEASQTAAALRENPALKAPVHVVQQAAPQHAKNMKESRHE
jgi:hypothetical protein